MTGQYWRLLQLQEYLQDVLALHYTLCMQIFPTREFATFPEALQAVAREEVFQANTPVQQHLHVPAPSQAISVR